MTRGPTSRSPTTAWMQIHCFMAPPPRTFRLQEGSPAYKLGFKPIPFEKIGLYESEYRRVVVR